MLRTNFINLFALMWKVCNTTGRHAVSVNLSCSLCHRKFWLVVGGSPLVFISNEFILAHLFSERRIAMTIQLPLLDGCPNLMTFVEFSEVLGLLKIWLVNDRRIVWSVLVQLYYNLVWCLHVVVLQLWRWHLLVLVWGVRIVIFIGCEVSKLNKSKQVRCKRVGGSFELTDCSPCF